MGKYAPHKIHKLPFLRRLALPVVKALSPGDVTWKHHYTRQRFKLHFWKHKGYWYHGKKREEETMEFFSAALKPGETAIEVGGHIGYISMHLANIVGDSGKVIVFEPGSNNLKYTKHNLDPLENVELIEKAVSGENGVAHFHEEDLTGQNNSLVEDYDVFEKNRDGSNSNAQYQVREVPTVTLDSFVEERSLSPALIKIDVEGAELQVLEGSRSVLENDRPAVMIEVTNEREQACELLTSVGYQLFDTHGRPTSANKKMCNVFALDPDKHQKLIVEVKS